MAIVPITVPYIHSSKVKIKLKLSITVSVIKRVLHRTKKC
jgi:hypothetical protein